MRSLIYVLIAFGIAEVCLCRVVDPDENRNCTQVIESRGFISETHYVTTKDGYTLRLFRIVNPYNKPSSGNILRPVVLQHGLFAQGTDFLYGSPGGGPPVDPHNSSAKIGNNLGFVLSNLGYDVWLSNSRGTTYSRGHVRLDADKGRFKAAFFSS